jgi:hypothetical protein
VLARLESSVTNVPHRNVRGCNHAFVNRFILLPKFSLAPVEVDRHKSNSASGSGSMRVRIPQPPSPPGLLGPDPGRRNPSLLSPLAGIEGRGCAFLHTSAVLRVEMITLGAEEATLGELMTSACLGRASPCKLRRAIRRGLASIHGFSQYKDVNEAPIMAPGFSELPLCKITATASTPSNFIASIGTVKFSLFPFQLPSLTHRRTTLV